MIPQTLHSNRYRLGPKLGQGSFSTVYEAEDTVQQRLVAVKLFEHRGGLERFLRVQQEVSVLTQLDHPHIVKLYQLGQEAGFCYLIMELIQGKTLAAYLEERRSLEPIEAVSIVIQVAEALEHVHQHRIIHRDIKPANIMILEGSTLLVKVLDFGLARVVNIDDLFASKAVVGSFLYMAPEQTRLFWIPVDFPTDLYALGVVLYELLTGRTPFQGTEARDLIHQHVAKVPTRPTRINPAIAPLLEEIVLKLLRKDPQERYQTAGGLLADLRAYRDAHLAGHERIHFQLGQAERPERSLWLHTKMVGREAELAELQQGFRQAASGKGQVVLIAGEPGIGKTRLVNELRAYVMDNGGIFIAGKCNEQTRAFPYAPFAEAVQEYVHQVENLPAQNRHEVVQAIKEMIGEMGEELTKLLPEIKTLIGESSHLAALPWEQDKQVERFLSVASDFLISLGSANLPVLLFLDDLHWIDGGTLQLLERTIPKIAPSHLCIVGTYRDTQVVAGHPLHNFLKIWRQAIREIKLKFLSLQDLRGLLTDLLKMGKADARMLAQIIHGKTAGNPFFALEMVKALREAAALRLDDQEGWKFDSETVNRVPIALRVDEVIVQRLTHLSETSLDVLSHAAVIGRHFTFEELLHITAQEPDQILRSIDEAAQYQIILPRVTAAGDTGYSFAHDKILETLYKRIPDDFKRQLHQKIAESLEQRYGDRLQDVIFELALHFSRGRDQRKALRYSLMAGDLAQKTYANSEAAHFYETALGLVSDGVPLEGKDLGELKVTIQEHLGDVHCLLGRYDDANKMFGEIRPFFSDPLAVSRIETKMGTVFFRKGDTEETLKHFRQGLAALGIRQPQTIVGVVISIAVESVKQMAHTYFPKSFIKPWTPRQDLRDVEVLRLFELLIFYYYFINMKRCFQVHLKQLNLAERIGSLEFCRISYGLHELLCNAAGFHRRALRYAKKALALREMTEHAQRSSDTAALAIGDSALLAIGRAYYYLADWDNAIEYLRKAADQTKKVGNLWEAEVALGHLCMAHFGKGQLERLMQRAEDLLRLAEGVRDVRGKGWGHVLLALGYSHQGNLTRAFEHAEEAVRHSGDAGDQLITAMSLRVLGQIHLRAGDWEHAATELEKSRAVIARHQVLHDFITGTFVILAEAYLKGATARASQKRTYLAKARTALGIAVILGWVFKNWRARVHSVRGMYHWARGRSGKALTQFQKSLGVASELGERYGIANAHLLMGTLLKEENDERWMDHLRKAELMFLEVGTQLEVAQVRNASGLVPSEQGSHRDFELKDHKALDAKLKLKSLLEVCQGISAILNLDELLDRILDEAIKVIGAERGFLLLYENGELRVKVAHGVEKEDFEAQAFAFSRSLTAQVERTGSPVFTPDAQSDPQLQMHESVIVYGLRSIVCVPLKQHGRLLGVLYLDNRLMPNLFAEQEMVLMMAFASQAAIAIENASIYQQITDLNVNLEAKVQQRTAELARLNQELEESNTRLKELDRLKSQFISHVSHELRTPLTSIKGFAENMRAGLAGPLGDKQERYLARIQENTERLTRMIVDLLDLSRIEAGKIELTPTSVVLSQLAGEVVEQLRPLATAKRQRLEVHTAERGLTIRGDRDRLSQVITNLVDNAIKYTPEEGSITVGIAREGPDRARLSVSDTGVGIPKEFLPKVFERFFRAAHLHESGSKGLGLGLSIVKSLVELHGGTISVESVVGRGTTFHLIIPLRNPGLDE